MYLYVAGATLGLAASGELKSAQVLFGPTRIIAYYLDTVLPIRFARMLATSGGGIGGTTPSGADQNCIAVDLLLRRRRADGQAAA